MRVDSLMAADVAAMHPEASVQAAIGQMRVRAGTDRVSFEQVLEAVKALSERSSQGTRPAAQRSS